MAVVREVAQKYDLAVTVLRHAGKSGKARRSTQFEADADIVLTLKHAEGNQPETVRVLEGNGRFDIIPRRLQIELTEDKGYVSHGLDSRTQFKKARNTISRIEREDTGAHGRTLRRLANALGVDVAELVRTEDEHA